MPGRNSYHSAKEREKECQRNTNSFFKLYTKTFRPFVALLFLDGGGRGRKGGGGVGGWGEQINLTEKVKKRPK